MDSTQVKGEGGGGGGVGVGVGRVEAFFITLSSELGASVDQIKLIFILISSIPLSLIYPLLPRSTSLSTSCYSILISYIYLVHLMGNLRGFFQLLLVSVGTWFWIKKRMQWARKVGQRLPKRAAWEVMGIAMTYLCANHLAGELNSRSKDCIDETGAMMVLIMKVTSFAWSIHDGQKPIEELDAIQKVSRIPDLPALIDFLGYCFFFPSLMVGPSFTFASYTSYTSGILFYGTKNSEKKNHKLVLPPGRFRRAGRRLITGLLFLGVFSTVAGNWNHTVLLKPWVRELPLWKKVLLTNLAGFMARTKYYAVWCLAETAFVLSGMAWDPTSNKYIRSGNLKIRSIEFAENFKVLLDHWNINTNVWLRECVYKRVSKVGKKPGFKSTMATFTTSALWHGVNPCYYLTFLLGGFASSLARQLRAYIRPFFLPPGFASTALTKGTKPPQTIPKIIYDVLGIISVQLVLNFIVAPFIFLELGNTFEAWKIVDYYGAFLIFVPMIIFRLGGAKLLKGLLHAREAKFGLKKKKSEEGDDDTGEQGKTREREEEEAKEKVKKFRKETAYKEPSMQVPEPS